MSFLLNSYRAAGGGGGGSSPDSYYDDVVLLLNMDEANGGTAFTDYSKYNRTRTLVGSPVISSTLPPVTNGASMSLNGVDSSLSFADSDDFHIPGAFTWEAWVRSGGPVPCLIMGQRFDLSTHLWLELDGAGRPSFQSQTTGGNTGVSSPTAINDNLWHFLALDRDGSGHFRLYVDGVMVGKTTTNTFPLINQPYAFTVGATADAKVELTGHIGPVRVTKGVARYASDSGHAVPPGLFPTAQGPVVFSSSPAVASSGGAFAAVGDTLIATSGTFAPSIGATYTWQWLRDGSPIAGETGATYLLQSADLGAYISVQQQVVRAGAASFDTSVPRGPVGDPTYDTHTRVVSGGDIRIAGADTRTVRVRTS